MKTLIQKKILILLAGIWALFHALISLLYYLIDVSPLYAADAVLGGAVAIYAVLYLFAVWPRPRFRPRLILLIALLLWYALSILVMTAR